ncbi:MAG: permease-like cell division protein FtsX [Flavobacteriales bacterium]|nr:permease-like cell division protein FtsX [Flavobacteriales bacterium]
MSQKQDRFNKRRLRSSYISVVVSMTLVLFLMGLLSTVLYHSKAIADQVQENIAFTVLLKPDAKQVMVKQFQRQLELSEHVKTTEFISKDEAAKDLENDLGEDFINFLGFNPLTDAIDIHFQAYYTQTNNPENIEKELLAIPVVQEVVYDKSLIKLLNDNLQKVSYTLLALSLVFSLIAIALINSSIRLTIYSKRFLIKTMQLVGATKTFIRKPFIKKSLQHGLLASVLAIICLDLLIRYGVDLLPEIQRLHKPEAQIALYSGILCLGFLIPWGCTYFAVRKYLKLTTDELHY